MGIYSSIEEELKNRLNDGTEENYYVEAVELKQENSMGKEETQEYIGYIRLTVKEKTEQAEHRIEIVPITIGGVAFSEKENAGFSKDEEDAMKSRYGERLGVDPERIKIVKSNG